MGFKSQYKANNVGKGLKHALLQNDSINMKV